MIGGCGLGYAGRNQQPTPKPHSPCRANNKQSSTSPVVIVPRGLLERGGEVDERVGAKDLKDLIGDFPDDPVFVLCWLIGAWDRWVGGKLGVSQSTNDPVFVVFVDRGVDGVGWWLSRRVVD